MWLELTFLLVVSLLASFVLARFSQSKVIGCIVVGVVIGPSVLNIIRPTGDSASGLPESVMLLAQLGAIVLLFMIGPECEPKEIYTRKSIAIAATALLSRGWPGIWSR